MTKDCENTSTLPTLGIYPNRSVNGTTIRAYPVTALGQYVHDHVNDVRLGSFVQKRIFQTDLVMLGTVINQRYTTSLVARLSSSYHGCSADGVARNDGYKVLLNEFHSGVQTIGAHQLIGLESANELLTRVNADVLCNRDALDRIVGFFI